MLKLRVITALVLVAIVLGALFGLSRDGFAIVAAVFFLAAGWEWSGLMGRLNIAWRGLWLLVLAVGLLACEYFRPDWLHWLALWWVLALLMVVIYPKWSSLWNRSWLLALLGWLLLIPSFESVVSIKADGALGLAGPFALLFILVWVWAADTGAYFAGRAFGKHKLASAVSPGKTIEGLIGGVLLALVITLLVLWLAPVAGSVVRLLVMAMVTVLASVLGDLFESMVKRQAGVKDSGKLLPGHGGMLDRIDSITAALPVAVAMLSWLALPGGGMM
jgi:phosphatidate cytidylyltransferase